VSHIVVSPAFPVCYAGATRGPGKPVLCFTDVSVRPGPPDRQGQNRWSGAFTPRAFGVVGPALGL